MEVSQARLEVMRNPLLLEKIFRSLSPADIKTVTLVCR